jgi:uncharacterized protein (TIGR03067 family)
MKINPVWIGLVCALLNGPWLLMAEAGEDQRDPDEIEGAWTVVAGEKGGRKAPPEDLKGGSVVFDGGKFTWKLGSGASEGTYTLDNTQSPRQITLMGEGKKASGIYKIDEGELSLCVGEGNDRPTQFATRPGLKMLLLVLKRERR